MALLERGVAARPDDAEAHSNLGNALATAGRADEALAAQRRAADIDPGFAPAHYNMGNTLLGLGRAEEAVEAYRQAVSLAPSDANAHNNLGAALRELGRFEEAVAAHLRALELRPGHAPAANNLGIALREAGRPDEAEAAYRQAIALDPGFADAYANLGNALQEVGRLDDAKAAYRRAITLAPNQSADAYRNLVDLAPDALDDRDVAALEALLAQPSLPEDQAMRLCFALGQAYEHRQDFDRAFARFARGNHMKRATLTYDVAADEDRVDRLMASYPADRVARCADLGYADDTPIFVVGMPRSGTTLVEQILASHSLVFGGGELTEFGTAAARLAPALGGGIAADPDGAALAALGEAYVAALRRRAPEARHITDKLPGNVFHVGLIALALPRVRIVYCVRDPVDTCLACYRKLFVIAHGFAYDLTDLGRYCRLTGRLMAHWQAVLPGRILDVRYEDVVAHQERETRRLLDFCGLPWEDGCLAFHRTQRPVQTASAGQVRRALYSGAVRRWDRYRNHLEPLLEVLGYSVAPDQGAG